MLVCAAGGVDTGVLTESHAKGLLGGVAHSAAVSSVASAASSSTLGGVGNSSFVSRKSSGDSDLYASGSFRRNKGVASSCAPVLFSLSLFFALLSMGKCESSPARVPRLDHAQREHRPLRGLRVRIL